MKEDIDPPKVVYLNKYKRRKKINWPFATGQHPWDSKNPWHPGKDENLPENPGKIER